MPPDRIRATIRVQGIVQGVGFRPFVYRRARAHELGGSVRNTGGAGVEIVLEGEAEAVEGFLSDLRESPPPLSRVESIDVERRPLSGTGTEPSFEIVPSVEGGEGAGTIPPDTGMCEACLEDLREQTSRYHGYWATSCTDCGPRYTVIRSLPYDRPRTAMDAYPMCEECRAEYEEPADRRYHAQTIACPSCGPTLRFEPEADRVGGSGAAAIDRTVTALQAGEILAIKGIGGTHLACKGTDRSAVERLRKRSGRPGKPFALMAPSVERIERFAHVSSTEREELERVRRPIVLLEGRDREWLEPVAPGLHTIGVMLPYAGLHHLLFEAIDDPLVVTSANLPGEPMVIATEEIWTQLGSIIDGALLHDREIVARTDDSVKRVVDGTPRFIRRSRGWVPQPLPRRVGSEGQAPTVLATGPEFDATVALARDEEVIVSQHIGDVDGPATRAFHEETIEHLRSLLSIDPSVVACDLHPEFVTTAIAESMAEDGLEGPLRVQHHHAHAVSLLGEHDRERAIVIVADGTGYGPDGTIWGGEVLDARFEDFDRVGGLAPFTLPGGEAAVRRPARILASLLEDEDRVRELLLEQSVVSTEREARTILEQADRTVNAPTTTSAGRFLDAISALLGAGTKRRYEGEPAMRLEALASRGEPVDLMPPIERSNGRRVVETHGLTNRLHALQAEHSRGSVAATAQVSLARGLATVAIEAARDVGLEAVGFTGGVAYNEAITHALRSAVDAAGLTFLEHERVPPGDAGIAYGQALAATARLSNTNSG
ncbi:MAG: carbamoyltransferase HypF [Halodesulfurarchaeum sp.]